MIKERTAKNNRNVLKIIILFSMLAAIFCSVLIAMNEDITAFNWEEINPLNLMERLHKRTASDENIPFYLGDLDVLKTSEYQGNLLVLTNSDIRLLNHKGEEIWYNTHEIGQPNISICGNWILLYEKNGKSYMVLNDRKVLLKDTTDDEISFGQITEKNIFFITINNNGYKRTISEVSLENGIELGALYIDDYFPYYAKTINNDKYFILSGLGMNSTTISTIIRIYESTLKTSPIASLEIESLYPVMHDNGKSYIFVGEEKVLCYNSELDLLWSKEFDGKIVSAGMFEDGGAIISLSEDSDMLYFYNNSGENINSVANESEIQGIVVYNNMAAVIAGSEVSFYQSSGKRVDSVVLAGMRVHVHFRNSDQAFLVTEHEAVLHNIKP